MSDTPSDTPSEPATDITVRQAFLSDLDGLALLFDQYRQFQGQPSDLAAARNFLFARFDHAESIIFIALQGGEALGFAQLYPSFSSVAMKRVFILNDLFVAQAGRRRNIASRLLAALEHYAWSVGAVRVSLNVARPNAPAQALYESQGWKQDDQFFMYHRYPEV